MKKILVVLLASLFVFITVPFAISADQGTAIATADDLVALMLDSTKWDGDYYLSADIDLSGKTTQSPIGNSQTKFTGTFDGKGKTISGLDIVGESYIGLFGYATDATIKNLTVNGKVQSLVSTGTDVYAAGLCGALSGNSTIENVTVNAEVSATASTSTQSVAGLVGKVGISEDNATITIKNCHTNCNVSAARGVASMISVISMGGMDAEGYVTVFSGGKINISDCTSKGTIKYNSGSSFGQSGGMIGNLLTNLGQNFEINLTNCRNDANVSGETLKARMGGVIGWITSDKADSAKNSAGGTINLTNCVNTGKIEGSGDVGGVVGYVTLQFRTDYVLNMENCVNTGAVIASGTGAGGVFGTNKGGVFNLKGCANYGSISADSKKAGGLMGYSETAGTTAVLSASFTDCANYGTVTSFTTVAGILGSGNSKVEMTRCFNGGKLVCIDLTGTKAALGASLTGNVTVKDSYFIDDNMDINGQSVSKADAAKTSTFNGWDFTNTWTIEDNRPTLKNITVKGPSSSGSEDDKEQGDSGTQKPGDNNQNNDKVPGQNVGNQSTTIDTSKPADTAANTTDKAPADNGTDFPAWIIAVVAVAVILVVAVVVIVVKKSKK